MQQVLFSPLNVIAMASNDLPPASVAKCTALIQKVRRILTWNGSFSPGMSKNSFEELLSKAVAA